jgi:hypothetical protein
MPRVRSIIKEMRAADRAALAQMRAALSNGKAIGFAQVAVRKYANGCDTQPVAFLERIWVDPQFRRRGIGSRLNRICRRICCGTRISRADRIRKFVTARHGPRISHGDFPRLKGLSISKSVCSRCAEDRVPTISERRRTAKRQVELVINQLFASDYFAILIIKFNGNLSRLRYW